MMFTSEQFSLLEGSCLTRLTMGQHHSYMYHICLYKCDDAIDKTWGSELPGKHGPGISFSFPYNVFVNDYVGLYLQCDSSSLKFPVGTAFRKTNKRRNETSLLNAYQNPFFTSVATYLFIPSFLCFFYSFTHSFIFYLTVVSKNNPQGKKK